MVILDGQVTVNGQTELQEGKKLHDGDVFSYNGETVKGCEMIIKSIELSDFRNYGKTGYSF